MYHILPDVCWLCAIFSATDAASVAASNISASAHDSLDVPESRLDALEEAVKVCFHVYAGMLDLWKSFMLQCLTRWALLYATRCFRGVTV